MPLFAHWEAAPPRLAFATTATVGGSTAVTMHGEPAISDTTANADQVRAAHAISADPWVRRPVVCIPFAGGLVGGSHLSAIKLIKALDHAQFEPLVLLHSAEGPLARLMADEGIRVEEAPVRGFLSPDTRPGLGAFAALVDDMRRMIRFLRRRNVRIVHTNEGPMHATWSLPARIAGARHIWHHRGNPRAAGLRYLAPFLATRVVSVSHYAAPAAGLLSARRKCEVVYSPFDTGAAAIDRCAARATAIASLGVAPDTRLVAFVGQFATRKRPLVFIETIATLRRQHPELPILGLMFGEEFEPGQDAAIDACIAANGVGDHIRRMGFVRPVEPWLAACDALCVPAVEEPFGRTLIEAMLIGTPVVAAADGGNAEAIRNRGNGLLARPDSAGDFAARIAELIVNPGLADAIAHRARQEAQSRFGIGAHARRITEIYREALAA